jgi:hypothetical protein
MVATNDMSFRLSVARIEIVLRDPTTMVRRYGAALVVALPRGFCGSTLRALIVLSRSSYSIRIKPALSPNT